MKSIIMAGGSGTRLWPYSRENFPKQFLSLFGQNSFLQTTAQRLVNISGPEDVFIVTGSRYKFSVVNQMNQIMRGAQGKSFSNLILEPSGRNTAPAIALSVKYMLEHVKVDENELLFFSPSDHLIKPDSALYTAIQESLDYAEDHIITFGVTPRSPETGYGYVELGKSGKDSDSNMYVVNRFAEKPDKETAQQYLDAGNYAWNSGMFMFSVKAILAAFKEHVPELYKAIKEMSYDKMVEAYDKLPAESIDYAVMEKSDKILCKKIEIDWSDIGSWDSVYEYLPKDDDGNAIQGRVECLDVKNSLVISGKNLTTVIGLENVAVIETEDAVLVCDRNNAQNVREIVKRMKNTGRKEAIEHVTTFRPWGSYTILEEGKRYKIKRIVVNPGSKLSLQRHRHRSEHWVVVSGMAEVEIGNQRKNLHENESVYVPVFELHRLTNPGRIPLEIIEVQNGEYVGEDDIERFEDVYGREEEKYVVVDRNESRGNEGRRKPEDQNKRNDGPRRDNRRDEPRDDSRDSRRDDKRGNDGRRREGGNRDNERRDGERKRDKNDK